MRGSRRRVGWIALLTLGLGLLAACGRDVTPTAAVLASATVTSAPSAPTVTPAGSPGADSTPGFDTSAVPPAPAPHGLAQVALPDTPEAVEALLTRMPDKLANKQRAGNTPAPGPGAYEIVYGDPKRADAISLTILPVTVQDYLAPFGSAGGYIAYTLSLPEPDGSPKEGGRDGALLWSRSTRVIGSEGAQPGQPTPTSASASGDVTTYTMLWGADGGGWVFGAVAGSPADLDDLVGAFSQAVNPNP